MNSRNEVPGESTFAAAATRYDAELHRFLRRRVARAEDLGDLVQEVYLRLMRIRDAEMVRNPLAYIYGVAANVVSEFNLRERNARVIYDSPSAEALAESGDHDGFADGGAYFERPCRGSMPRSASGSSLRRWCW